MKKLFLIIVICFSTILFVQAAEGYGSCMMPGTSDYVEVTVIDNGDNTVNIVISNSSEKPLTSLHIKVVVTISGYSGSFTIYDKNHTKTIEAYSNHVISNIPTNKNGRITSFDVKIGNPICK